MKPEEFKQNVKDRVRVFEDGGIRLLKKGKRGIIRAVFGRTGLVLALFFVQVLLLFSVFRWFTALVPHLLGGSIAFTAVMVIYLLNSDMDNSAKITWLVVIALVPVLGVVLFWWTKGEVGHRMLKRRLKRPKMARKLQVGLGDCAEFHLAAVLVQVVTQDERMVPLFLCLDLIPVRETG